MSEKSELRALGERVAAASSRHDRDLDAALYNALVDDGGRIAFKVADWSKKPGSNLSRFHDGWLVGKSADDEYAENLPSYSASLDAAMALVERKLPGCWYIMSKEQTRPDEPLFACELIPKGDHSGKRYLGVAEAETQPFAIIASLLAALVSEPSQS